MLPETPLDRPPSDTSRLARALVAIAGVLVGLAWAGSLPQASARPQAAIADAARPAVARVVRHEVRPSPCAPRSEAARADGAPSHSLTPSRCR